MSGKKKFSWNRLIVKAFIVLSIVLILGLGINYRPIKYIDYSTVQALQIKDGVTMVDFEFLGGFDYENGGVVPEKVKELDGKRIEIQGFMLPIDFEDSVVTSFMLLNNQMGCCFGVLPRVNDFVYAELPEGKTTKFMIDTPLTVTGTLEITDRNLVGGIYSLTTEKVEKVKN